MKNIQWEYGKGGEGIFDDVKEKAWDEEQKEGQTHVRNLQEQLEWSRGLC